MFKLMSKCCNQCLMTPRKIVSDARRKEILKQTRRDDCHFQCHKASIAGLDVACRGHFEATGGGQLARIAERLGAIELINPETMKEAQS